MPDFHVDFRLESGARAVDMRWRAPDEPYERLGRFLYSPATVTIPDGVGVFEVEVRPLGADRKPHKGTVLRGDTRTEPTNRPDLTAATPADPKVDQDGPVLTIQPTVPDGFDADEYEVEVRVSDTGTSDPTDALQVGFVRPGDEIPSHVCPGEDAMTVHHRLVRRETGRATDWGTLDVDIGRGVVEGTQGHSNDFASGSLLERVTNYTPLEISGGDLQLVGLSHDDLAADISLDDLRATLNLWDLRPTPSEGTYQTADVTLDAAEDLQFQAFPKLTSHAPRDFSLDEFRTILPAHYPDEVDGAPVDESLREMGLTLDGDRAPVEVEIYMATSSSESPTWTDADFILYRPGDVRSNVRTYAARVRIIARFGGQFVIDEIDIRHWVFCKSRRWCQVGRDFQLIAESELAGDAASLSLSVDGADWAELAVEIDWTNANASATRLAVRFNGSASEEVFLTESGDALAAVDWRERFLVHLRPATGARRYLFVAEQHQYKDASVNDVDAPSTKVWDDTATAITSLQFITNQPASAYLGTGTRVRLYGRREYGA